MKEYLLKIFGELVVEARNSGIEVYKEIENGWEPKNPDEQLQGVLKFISSLTNEQKKLFVNALAYFTDLSFFKLMDTIDNGFSDVSIGVTVENEFETIEIAGKYTDNDLIHNYWTWVDEYGIEKR